MSKNKQRNYSLHHEDNPHLNDVTSHEDGTCTFMLDSIPDLACRTINVYKDGLVVFSISIGHSGVAYQTMLAGQDMNLYTLCLLYTSPSPRD